MEVRSSLNGYAVKVIQEDKDLYSLVQYLIKNNDKTNLSRLGTTLLEQLSKSMFPKMNSFTHVDVSVSNNGVTFVTHDEVADEDDIDEIYASDSINVVVDSNEIINTVDFTYNFFRIDGISSAFEFSDFGGAIVEQNGQYFIKSSDYRYFDFLEAVGFMTQYRVVFEDIQEIEQKLSIHER